MLRSRRILRGLGTFKMKSIKDYSKKIFSGGTPNTTVKEYWCGHLPWLSSGETRNRYITKTEKLITREAVEKSSTRLAKKHDIVIASAGQGKTRGQTSFCLIDTYVNQSVIVIRPDEDKVEPYFLFSNISSRYEELRAFSDSNSIRGSLTVKDFMHFPISLPELEYQKRCVVILKKLDDKIELNQKINKTLESIAQTIFKSWFVDFDPVHAKNLALKTGLTAEQAERAAMAVISGVCSPQAFAENFDEMNSKLEEKLSKMSDEKREELAHTASLFPSEFEDSELGMIPREWEAIPIYSLINVVGGGTPKRSEKSFWNGDIPWFSVKDIPSNGITVFDTEEHITELGLRKSSTKVQQVGSTIVTARGTVGKIALVLKDMAMNQSCYGVYPKDGIGTTFNYFNLSQVVETLKRNAHGAVFDTITHDTFKTCMITFGGFDLARSFEIITKSMVQKIYSNQLETKSLGNLRDTLLPKLLAGEIDLSNIKIENNEK